MISALPRYSVKVPYTTTPEPTAGGLKFSGGENHAMVKPPSRVMKMYPSSLCRARCTVPYTAASCPIKFSAVSALTTG